MAKLKNLAGHEDSTELFERELRRCGVAVYETEPEGEVKAAVRGEISGGEGFTVTRAWNYFVVKGPVPLELAKTLYADAVGRTDIRVAGHCGCPPPEDFAVMLDRTGRKVWPREEWDKVLAMPKDSSVRKIVYEQKDKEFVVGEGHSVGKFVTTYHIDSELGLYLFVSMVNEHFNQGAQRCRISQ